MLKRIILALILVVPFLANSQSIVSDRPGQSFSPTTVSPNTLQWQSGLQYTEQCNDCGVQDFNTFLFTNFFRYGILNILEIDGGIDYLSFSMGPSGGVPTSNGISSLIFGGRLNFLGNDGGSTTVGLMGLVNFSNWVSEDFQTDDPATVVKLLLGQSINDQWGLAANLGFSTNGGGDSQGDYTFNVSYAPFDKWSFFLENYGSFDNNDFNTFFDGGAGFLLSDKIQLDLFLGYGKNEGFRDLFVSGGISWNLKS